MLLHASRSEFLRRRAEASRGVKRALRRFVPGEELEDALDAIDDLRDDGIRGVYTRLGENVSEPDAAREVARHYVASIERVEERGLDAEPSVKLTQLGLDLSDDLALEGLQRVLDTGAFVWVDMESSQYLDRTLDLYRSVREDYEHVGVCLQAYLHRTPMDLQAILRDRGHVRLVKGAYREPPSIALQRRRHIDRQFLGLGRALLTSAREHGLRHAFATHDEALIRRLCRASNEIGVNPAACEVQMLYGIQSALQGQLAREGLAVRVLVSYGSAWFAWYVRRLAERPANLGLLARNLAAR